MCGPLRLPLRLGRLRVKPAMTVTFCLCSVMELFAAAASPDAQQTCHCGLDPQSAGPVLLPRRLLPCLRAGGRLLVFTLLLKAQARVLIAAGAVLTDYARVFRMLAPRIRKWNRTVL